MRSLLVTLEYPPDVGGVSVLYDHLTQEFPQGDIIVLTNGKAQTFLRGRVRVIQRPLIWRFPLLWPKWLPMVYYIWKVMRSEHIRLLQAGQVLPVGTAVWIIHKIFRIPYMVFGQGMDIVIPRSSPRKSWLLGRILTNAEFVVTISAYTKSQILSFGVPEKNILMVYPCPNMRMVRGVAPQEIEQLRRQYGINQKKIILSVGRLVERKGYDITCSAVAKLRKTFPNLLYVIAGEGAYRMSLEKIVDKLDVRDHVLFIGKISDQDLPVWYAAADIFCMVPRQTSNGDVEGFGIVYLEANTFGKPVVGGKSGGVPDAVVDGKTGLLVNPTDSEDLAKALEMLLNNPSFAKLLGEEGRKRVFQDFQWAKQAKPLINRINHFD